MSGSRRSHPARCAYAPVAGQSKPTFRPWAQPMALASAHAVASKQLRAVLRIAGSLALNAEGVDHAVERRDEGSAICDRQAAVVTPRRDLVAAVPQLASRQGVERIERCTPRSRNAANAGIADGAANLCGR